MQDFSSFVSEKSALLAQLDELKHGVKEFDEAVKKSARSDARQEKERVKRADAFKSDSIDITSYLEATKKMKAAFRRGFAAKLHTKKVYSSLLLKLACLLDELSQGIDELGISLAQTNASFHEDLAEQATYFERMIEAADKLHIASLATRNGDASCSILGMITIRSTGIDDAPSGVEEEELDDNSSQGSVTKAETSDTDASLEDAKPEANERFSVLVRAEAALIDWLVSMYSR